MGFFRINVFLEEDSLTGYAPLESFGAYLATQLPRYVLKADFGIAALSDHTSGYARQNANSNIY